LSRRLPAELLLFCSVASLFQQQSQPSLKHWKESCCC
jgi:hypothetical protein